MTMNVLRYTTQTRWLRAAALTVPLLLAQSIVPAALQPYTDQALIGVANAAEDKEKKPEQKTRRTQALNNKVYEKLQAAQEAVEAKDYKAAFEELNDLKTGSKPLNDYEMANVLNLEAYVYYAQENYTKALTAYKQIIVLPEAPEGTIIQARYSVAQLYFVTEQFREGVDALLEWFKAVPEAGASAYILLAQGYYQLKEYDLSLKNVETAIGMYKTKGKVPKENWYGLQRFLYYEKDNFRKVVEILNELLTHYPKKQYWMQLSAMQSELKSDSKQLAAMEVAYRQGMLDKEKELVNLAYLLLANEVPYKAAKVLDKGIKDKIVEATSKNLELLGNSWRSAQEIKKAIPEMRAAAAKSKKGELWARLGNIYLDNDEYKKAIKAIESGLKKGGVKRADTAQLVKGMAHFNLKQYKSAKTAFEKAKKDKRTEKYATQWLQHMASVKAREESLKQI